MKKLILVLLLIPSIVLGYEAEVIKVVDGDTIKVKIMDRPEYVRLYGIDAPEKPSDKNPNTTGQPYGLKAKKFLESSLPTKYVDIDDKGRDMYGRIIGIVKNSDSQSINELMLSEGYAWYYRQYCKLQICQKYEELFENAVVNRKGLFKDTNPVNPAEFRKHKKGK